jgi:hypothetical protein
LNGKLDELTRANNVLKQLTERTDVCEKQHSMIAPKAVPSVVDTKKDKKKKGKKETSPDVVPTSTPSADELNVC